MPSSRKSHIFGIFFWVVIFTGIILLYHYLLRIDWWTPRLLTLIDTSYLIARTIAFVAIITNIISLSFREIRHSGAIENIFVRRFLPIGQFLVVASAWIVWFFYIFDALNIDTSNILAWAWIWWAILALAGKDIMTNLFGSLSILLSRTFDIGESIAVGRKIWERSEWIVEEITLNYTKLTNISWEVVFIPNRFIYTEIVENLSRRRFFEYKYLIPFNKSASNSDDIKERLRIIEWKIDEFNPISIEWTAENPNSSDYVYKVSVKLPDENLYFDNEIREFLIPYIFSRKEK